MHLAAAGERDAASGGGAAARVAEQAEKLARDAWDAVEAQRVAKETAEMAARLARLAVGEGALARLNDLPAYGPHLRHMVVPAAERPNYVVVRLA